MALPFQPAADIDEVIARLNVIIDNAAAESSAMGIFPSLYLVVTEKVKEGIATTKNPPFQDGPRMEKLDVIFANRFLEAFHQFQNGEKTSKSWEVAFRAAESFPKYIILQELLVGMNAHINLDLGIAAAQTCPGEQIDGLKTDFFAINKILSSLIGEIKQDLEGLSPRLARLIRMFKGKEDAILDFSIDKARDAAWQFAVKLAESGNVKDQWLINIRDDESAVLGDLIVSRGPLIRLLICWIKQKEVKDIKKIVTELRNNFTQRVSF